MAGEVPDERATTGKDINSVISSLLLLPGARAIRGGERTKGEGMNEGESVDRASWPGRPAGENPKLSF